MVAGVEPQSSCSFNPAAPLRICSSSPCGSDVLPLPRKPKFIGSGSFACSISSMCRLPGVHVVALVPVAGPVPPPMNVVTPLATASYTCWGEMKCTWASMAPAVRINPSPAMASVVTPTTRSSLTPAMTSGLPALPMPAIRPFLMPTSALRMPVQSTIRALVITQSRARSSDTPAACPMPSRKTLPPPNLHSSP